MALVGWAWVRRAASENSPGWVRLGAEIAEWIEAARQVADSRRMTDRVGSSLARQDGLGSA